MKDPIDSALIYDTILESTELIRSDLSSIRELITETGVKVTDESAVKIAEEVTLRIVGEAYKKWDSCTSYFPALVLIFKETGVTSGARRTQIKGRLFKSGKDLTDEDIQQLKDRANKDIQVVYSHGKLRGNYVSTDKRWKSTIYGASKEAIIGILKDVCFIIGEDFESHSLTFTDGPRRVSHTRRNDALVDIQPLFQILVIKSIMNLLHFISRH